MSATITTTRGYTFGATELVTNTKLHTLIDSATSTISGIVGSELASGASVVDFSLAAISTAGKVSGSALTSLANIPADAGVIPAANLTSVAQKGANTDITSLALTGSINPTNLLSNGDFENWSAGTSAAPDGWTLSGASATAAREGTIIKLGTYSAKVTRAGADCQIYQAIHTAKGIAYWKGRTVTFGCWVYATVADRARIILTDGVTVAYSSYHTGDSTWQWLTQTFTVDSTATYLQARLFVDTGDTSAYFDGAMCVEGESAFAFSPKPPEEGVWSDYSATSTVVGWSAFTTKEIYTKKVGNLVFVNFYLAGTSDNATTTFTLPYTAKNVGISHGSALTITQDNNTILTTPGRITVSANSNLATATKDMAGGAFTNSNSKSVAGNFWYEAA